jgi:hypothetical protein
MQFAEPRALTDVTIDRQHFVLDAPFGTTLDRALDPEFLSRCHLNLRPGARIEVCGGNPSVHWLFELRVVEVWKRPPGMVSTMLTVPPRFIEPNATFVSSGRERNATYIEDRFQAAERDSAKMVLDRSPHEAEKAFLTSLRDYGKRPSVQLADMFNQLEQAFDNNRLTRQQYTAAFQDLCLLIADEDGPKINDLRAKLRRVSANGAARVSAA